MRIGSFEYALVVTLGVLLSIQGVFGIRFVIDKKECFSHKVDYALSTVHFSFVVIKAEENMWHYTPDGVDVVVTGPSGQQVHDFRDKISEKFEFTAYEKGVYRFCFTNNSPYHTTMDFDIIQSQFSFNNQHAKDEHLSPLLEQIQKLKEALHDIRFQQHWLSAQTRRQALINERMSRRAIHKAICESAALVGTSVLQVFLLKRLFEKKMRS